MKWISWIWRSKRKPPQRGDRSFWETKIPFTNLASGGPVYPVDLRHFALNPLEGLKTSQKRRKNTSIEQVKHSTRTFFCCFPQASKHLPRSKPLKTSIPKLLPKGRYLLRRGRKPPKTTPKHLLKKCRGTNNKRFLGI